MAHRLVKIVVTFGICCVTVGFLIYTGRNFGIGVSKRFKSAYTLSQQDTRKFEQGQYVSEDDRDLLDHDNDMNIVDRLDHDRDMNIVDR